MVHCIPGEEDEKHEVDPVRYQTGPDANMRLSGTIIRDKNGNPFYVIQVLSQTQATGVYLKSGPNGDPFHFNPNDPGIDISSPNVGYMNFKGAPLYLQRQPERRQKQGLDTRRVLIRKDKATQRLDEQFNNGYWPNLHNTILGVYPSLHSCLAEGGAFNRFFAIRKGSNSRSLEFMGYTVGLIRSNNRILLKGSYNTTSFTKMLHSMGLQT